MVITLPPQKTVIKNRVFTIFIPFSEKSFIFKDFSMGPLLSAKHGSQRIHPFILWAVMIV
ncbi:hypothetical protein ELI_1491 [Eubacterium callanderi]|uniref:Uncharacterized protein n=1 Tax=Eubacterium callanderi TaxID=53442 RepID=E3GLV6_9FIRM|nr:hypothetical protein ELI_1491 [Eubacterium callanderi]